VNTARPELLFLCQNLPFPPDGGAAIRSFHTLRLLSREYEVTALCFVRSATRPDEDSVRRGVHGLSEYADVEAFPIPQEQSRGRLVFDHLRSLLGGRAYTRWAYESAPYRRRLQQLTDEKDFSVVHLDSLDLVGYLPELTGARVVVAHHNVESQLLARRAESESGLLRHYMRLQARRTIREEAVWCPRVDLNLVVSPEDQATLAQIAPGSDFLVVPNGVDTSHFVPAPERSTQGIVFVGGYTWFPNRDGMEYFADDILPLIRREEPDIDVTWVGRAPAEAQERFAAMGVDMTGYVDDIRPHVHGGRCFIVPLRVGGGTRLKILDAWALGKALVSTTQGAEGLAGRNGENMLIADEPQSFADAVLRVLRSTSLRSRLEEEGRKTAVEFYDWDVIGVSMMQGYRAVLTSSPSYEPA